MWYCPAVEVSIRTESVCDIWIAPQPGLRINWFVYLPHASVFRSPLSCGIGGLLFHAVLFRESSIMWSSVMWRERIASMHVLVQRSPARSTAFRKRPQGVLFRLF